MPDSDLCAVAEPATWRWAVTSQEEARILGVWGSKVYAWSGEERPRAAGFPVDVTGRQRVLGFPADPSGPIDCGWLHSLSHPIRRHRRRA
jgi:hypothetical protein